MRAEEAAGRVAELAGPVGAEWAALARQTSITVDPRSALDRFVGRRLELSEVMTPEAWEYVDATDLVIEDLEPAVELLPDEVQAVLSDPPRAMEIRFESLGETTSRSIGALSEAYPARVPREKPPL